MAISSKYLLKQGSALAALGEAALTAAVQSVRGVPSGTVTTPGPELYTVVPPRDAGMVRDYVRHVGGSPSAYKRSLPVHLFPQWAFGLASKTLRGIPYPLSAVMNGGCRLEVFQSLPNNEPLHVRARLESIDDNGRRAVLHQRIVIGTPSTPDALIAHMYPIIPLRKKGGSSDRSKKKERPRVPDHAREVAFWRLRADAGLDFAKLTGDFNPIHWVPLYARMFGFRNTILHGFSTMARTMESLHQNLFAGSAMIREWDVRFTRPLVLPARVGVYVVHPNEVYVGDAPGGPAYLTGTFSTEVPSPSTTKE